MKIYISGPISGRDLPVVQADFDQAETMLTSQGNEVINPLKVPHREGFSWAQYMVDDLCIMMGCDAIWMLDGWEQSPGARIEILFAQGAGLKVLNLPNEKGEILRVGTFDPVTPSRSCTTFMITNLNPKTCKQLTAEYEKKSDENDKKK